MPTFASGTLARIAGSASPCDSSTWWRHLQRGAEVLACPGACTPSKWPWMAVHHGSLWVIQCLTRSPRRRAHDVGEFGEGVDGGALVPAALVLQVLRQVPVVQRHPGLEAALEHAVDQARIEGQALPGWAARRARKRCAARRSRSGRRSGPGRGRCRGPPASGGSGRRRPRRWSRRGSLPGRGAEAVPDRLDPAAFGRRRPRSGTTEVEQPHRKSCAKSARAMAGGAVSVDVFGHLFGDAGCRAVPAGNGKVSKCSKKNAARAHGGTGCCRRSFACAPLRRAPAASASEARWVTADREARARTGRVAAVAAVEQGVQAAAGSRRATGCAPRSGAAPRIRRSACRRSRAPTPRAAPRCRPAGSTTARRPPFRRWRRTAP